MAQALKFNEALGVKGAARMVRRLSVAGRWREAEETLRDPRFRLLESAEGQLELARAELGRGRLVDAAAAAARAREMDAELDAQAEAIETAALQVRWAQNAARKTGAWPETKALIDRCVDLCAYEPGFQALMDFLLGKGTIEGEQNYEFHLVLDTLLSVGEPESGYSLFRAMQRINRSIKVGYDLNAVADSLGAIPPGRPPRVPMRWHGTNARVQASAALAWGRAGRLEPAIDTLGALTLRFPKLVDLRTALARFVGQDVLKHHPLAFAPKGPRKVFDVFIFNNEIRLLKLKLHAMADWVDHFVLVEARQTFTGTHKPLVYKRRQALFEEFAHKIIHVVVDEFPAHVRHPWSREFYQRDMGVLGLNGLCAEDDLVIISDADEILSREAILGFEDQFAGLRMERARYFLNYREALPVEAQKEASSLWRARFLGRVGLSNARNVLRFDKKSLMVTRAGWHFTSVSDASGIAAKMNITAHQEHAGVTTEAVTEILERLRAGDFEPGWERCELDERFPAYLREHRDEFEDVLL
jgi:beta-1,4-mannosyl-glycoprotein beta-1,4-N-acetylglucosaminyltransferase